jgi:hypothetical protein
LVSPTMGCPPTAISETKLTAVATGNNYIGLRRAMKSPQEMLDPDGPPFEDFPT